MEKSRKMSKLVEASMTLGIIVAVFVMITNIP